MESKLQDRLESIGVDVGSLTDKRIETLTLAAPHVDDETLGALARAERVNRGRGIVLPKNHLETLSRGKGWCRQGKGADAVWAERVDGGYRVGPGRWTVGASDGFSRKRTDEWTVAEVQVGPNVWTIAN